MLLSLDQFVLQLVTVHESLRPLALLDTSAHLVLVSQRLNIAVGLLGWLSRRLLVS
jgi:hypothetical protein